jgi:hypothetical protein
MEDFTLPSVGQPSLLLHAKAFNFFIKRSSKEKKRKGELV